MGDFRANEDLAKGEIREIQWKDSGRTVTKNAHMIGLDPKLRESLLAYCQAMGITQIMKELTQEKPVDDDSYFELSNHTEIRLQGHDWYIQRANNSDWNSNMHWLSPDDAKAEQNFLEAFSKAGFDDVLQSAGQHFGFRGLAAYHLSVIAVSNCEGGMLHVDCTNTGSKSMNIIIPLILATGEESGPELKLEDTQSRQVGTYQYRYNVAVMVGDDAYHATGPVQYPSHEMRMAATIYIADINPGNIDAILSDHVTYAEAYPPPAQPEVLLKVAGAHWDPQDATKKLPSKSVLTDNF